jgi:twinkle protein
VELISDNFDLGRYLAEPNSDYRLDSPAKITASVIDMFYGDSRDEGDLMPWPKTHGLFKFRPGEVTVWCGINGHGKSMITSQVALDLAWNGAKPCIASLEMQPRRTMWRMVRQASGLAEPSVQYIKQFLGWMDRKLYIFDHLGTAEPQLILGAARFSHASHKVRHFFIDSLMKVCRGEDDYNGQKDFMDQATAMARDLNIHVHVIHHVRKGENELSIPSKFDGKGSGAISDMADNWITCWRNKRKEHALATNPTDAKAMAEPDEILNIDKQRNGEWEGRIGLWFHKESMSYVERAGLSPKRYELELEEVCVRTDSFDDAGGKEEPVPACAG